MPHLIIEYSKPLEQQVNITQFTAKIHDLLAQQPSFDKESIKSRAIGYEHYNVTLYGNKKDFLHIGLRAFEGRLPGDIKTTLQNLGTFASDSLPSSTEITIELCEIKKDFYFKKAASKDRE